MWSSVTLLRVDVGWGGVSPELPGRQERSMRARSAGLQ
jgi:hypothetical protein